MNQKKKKEKGKNFMYTEDGNRINSKCIIHDSYLGYGVKWFYLALWQIHSANSGEICARFQSSILGFYERNFLVECDQVSEPKHSQPEPNQIHTGVHFAQQSLVY
jgi:hypothetical protein